MKNQTLPIFSQLPIPNIKSQVRPAQWYFSSFALLVAHFIISENLLWSLKILFAASSRGHISPCFLSGYKSLYSSLSCKLQGLPNHLLSYCIILGLCFASWVLIIQSCQMIFQVMDQCCDLEFKTKISCIITKHLLQKLTLLIGCSAC